MRSIITAVIIIAATAPASAALKYSEPITVCSYLADFGLATKGWKNLYDNEYGCSSAYKEFGTGAPLANNLAYYVEGGPSTASIARLVININDRSSTASAHQELLKMSEALSLKVTGEKLPDKISSAIKSGKNAFAKVGLAKVEVKRTDWPTGKGYEIKVSFE